MSSINVLLQSIGIKSLTFGIVFRETVFRVRNIETSVTGTLHGTEYSASRGSFPQPNIKENFERSPGTISFFSHGMTAIRFSDTLILVRKSNLGQSTTSNEETRRICGSPVLETMFNSVFRQL